MKFTVRIQRRIPVHGENDLLRRPMDEILARLPANLAASRSIMPVMRILAECHPLADTFVPKDPGLMLMPLLDIAADHLPSKPVCGLGNPRKRSQPLLARL